MNTHYSASNGRSRRNGTTESQHPRYVVVKKSMLHRLIRFLLLALTVLSAYVFHFRDSQRNDDRRDRLTDMVSSKRTSMVPSKALLEKYSLTEEQCRKRFPGLMEEVEDIILVESSEGGEGKVRSVQGRIRKGELYVMPAKSIDGVEAGVPTVVPENRLRIDAPVASSVARLVTTRNTGPTWPYSAACNQGHGLPGKWRSKRLQIWAWSNRSLKTLVRKVSTINRDRVESLVSQYLHLLTIKAEAHIFRSLQSPLLKSTLDRQSTTGTKSTTEEPIEKRWVKIEDFCRFGYIIYTGDVSYSTGRTPYQQVCHLVIVPPSPKYLERTNHLAKSLFAKKQAHEAFSKVRAQAIGLIGAPHAPKMPVLAPPGGGEDSESEVKPTTKQTALSIPHTSHLPPADQTILVKPDWSDLETTVAFLKAYPEIAEAISKRAKEDIVDAVGTREYTNPAAEVCLRRALLKGWIGAKDRPVLSEKEMMMETRWTMGTIGDGNGGGLEVGVKGR